MLTQAAFAGVWQLQRQIDDRYGRQQGGFDGRAVFHDAGVGHLRYVEEGTIKFGAGPAFTAHRHYQWHFGDGIVEVRFADGGAFHHFVPEGVVAGTDHPCGQDHYKVQYDFRRWPDWQAVWTVTGPRKDYTSTSHYTL